MLLAGRLFDSEGGRRSGFASCLYFAEQFGNVFLSNHRDLNGLDPTAVNGGNLLGKIVTLKPNWSGIAHGVAGQRLKLSDTWDAKNKSKQISFGKLNNSIIFRFAIIRHMCAIFPRYPQRCSGEYYKLRSECCLKRSRIEQFIETGNGSKDSRRLVTLQRMA